MSHPNNRNVSQRRIDEVANAAIIARDGLRPDVPCTSCEKRGVDCKILLQISNKCGTCFKQHLAGCTKAGWTPPVQVIAAPNDEDDGKGDDEVEDVMMEAPAKFQVGPKVEASGDDAAAAEGNSNAFLQALARASQEAAKPAAANCASPRRPKPTAPFGWSAVNKQTLPAVASSTKPARSQKAQDKKPAASKKMHISDRRHEDLPLHPRADLYTMALVRPNDQGIRNIDGGTRNNRQVVDLPAGRYPIFQVLVDDKIMSAALILPKSKVFMGGMDTQDTEKDVARRERYRAETMVDAPSALTDRVDNVNSGYAANTGGRKRTIGSAEADEAQTRQKRARRDGSADGDCEDDLVDDFEA